MNIAGAREQLIGPHVMPSTPTGHAETTLIAIKALTLIEAHEKDCAMRYAESSRRSAIVETKLDMLKDDAFKRFVMMISAIGSLLLAVLVPIALKFFHVS